MSTSSRKHAYIILTPLNPTFIQENWGLKGYTIFFLFLLKTWIMGTRKDRLGEAVLTSPHNLCFEQKYEKYQSFLSENFQFFGGEILYIFE